MSLKHWIKRIGSIAGSALMVGLTMGAPNESGQRCHCPIECRCRTGDD